MSKSFEVVVNILVAVALVAVIAVIVVVIVFLVKQSHAQEACDHQHGVLLKQSGLRWACIERGEH